MMVRNNRTLTGNKADQISLLPWLLGMPFLALQIAAVARDVVSLDSPLPEPTRLPTC